MNVVSCERRDGLWYPEGQQEQLMQHAVARYQQAGGGATQSFHNSGTPVEKVLGASKMMNMKSEPQTSDMSKECAGCGKKITERFLLKALDMFWHEDCLKCGCCDCRLGEVGSTLYTKANLILCKRDYLRLFGSTGYCAACSKVIPAFEMVMRARNNVYHLECFACQQCNHRFCVGDRFYLCDNRILCEYDYEERMVFANMNTNTVSTNCPLPNLKQQRQTVSNSASGSTSVDSRIPANGGLPVTRNPHSNVRSNGVISTSE